MGDTQTDCQALLARLYEFVDGEISDDECVSLREHLEACPECMSHAEFERGVKDLIKRKCGESLPEGLADRLREQLRRSDSAG